MVASLLYHIIALNLSLTLLTTGIAKMVTLRWTAVDVAREGVVPARLAPSVVLSVALLEVALGAAWGIGALPTLAATATLGLSCAFLVS